MSLDREKERAALLRVIERAERYEVVDPLTVEVIAKRLIAAEDAIERVRAIDGKEFGDSLSEGRGRTMYLCGVSDVKAAIRTALDSKEGDRGD